MELTISPFLIVILIGDVPGVWHHESADEDHRIFKSAIPPSAITPRVSPGSWNIVEAGFRVTAASAAIGSMPNL